MRYCGRDFDEQEIETIRCLIASTPSASRLALSRLVCEKLSWVGLNGRLKEMSCRVAMLRMQRDCVIELPAPLRRNTNGRPYRRRTAAAEPQFPVTVPAGELDDLRLEQVIGRNASYLWNEYIDRYHYLGYKPLPGAQIRYFAHARGQILGLLGFGAAAWKTAPRDKFIGWTPKQREKNLHMVVNNARFLILPWVKSANLASRLLAMAARQLPHDWQERYGYRPVLLETFVEVLRFRGTCYKAAGWIYLGETKGRGKLDVDNHALLPVKAIWVLPIAKDFRCKLCSE